MAHGRAFMDDLDAARLQRGHVLLRASPGGLDDLNSAFDDGIDVFRVGRAFEAGQESKIDAERLVGHVVAAGDFLCERLRRFLRQAGDDAEAAGIRYSGRELGEADEMHAALDDRMLDAQQFGDSRLHWCSLVRGLDWCRDCKAREVQGSRSQSEGCFPETLISLQRHKGKSHHDSFSRKCSLKITNTLAQAWSSLLDTKRSEINSAMVRVVN